MKKKKEKPALQPFLMETQVLESINRTESRSPEGVLIESDEDDEHKTRNGGRPRDGDQMYVVSYITLASISYIYHVACESSCVLTTCLAVTKKVSYT